MSAREPVTDAVDAGAFTPWLDRMLAALRGEAEADVPCGSCTGCCTSSQFVHIGPEERVTLSRVPVELRFPAPGLPDGHVVLPYDERGHCPMLVDGACSIYEDRPRTCRTYDCRVFAAAGVDPDPGTQAAIADRTRRWRFTVDTPDAELHAGAVRSAAAYLREHAGDLPEPAAPTTPTRLAVLAVEAHDAFLAPGIGDAAPTATPEVGAVVAAVDRFRR